jgi:hypothetical protein
MRAQSSGLFLEKEQLQCDLAFQTGNCIVALMDKSSARLVCSLGLLTAGIGLMIVGGAGLILLGMILIFLADLRRPWTPRRAGALSALLILLVIDLTRNAHAVPRQSADLWFVVSLGGVWLWGVIAEVFRWWADRIKSDTVI